MTRNRGIRPRQDSATSAVLSVEPSSTTITSEFGRFSRMYWAIFSSVDGRRSSSLNEGMTIESSGALLTAIPNLSSHVVPARARNDKIPAAPRGTPGPGESLTPDVGALQDRWGQSFAHLLGVARAAALAVPARPPPPEWRQRAPIPSIPEYRLPNAHVHCRIREPAGAAKPFWPTRGGTRWYKLRAAVTTAPPPDNRCRCRFPALAPFPTSAVPRTSTQQCKAAKWSARRRCPGVRPHTQRGAVAAAQTRGAARCSLPRARARRGFPACAVAFRPCSCARQRTRSPEAVRMACCC